MSVLDMQKIRYINLLDSTSHVKTTNCFYYNNTIIFAVPRHMVSKAIGPDAFNVRRLQEKIGKRVTIVSEADGIQDAPQFIMSIVSPIRFKSVEVKEGELVLTAGNTQSKAALIGRNRRRYIELQQIVKDVFHLELKIL